MHVHLLTLVAPVLAAPGGVLALVARFTERARRVLEVARVRETRATDLADETVRMPVHVHGFDHTTDDKLL